MNYPLRDAILGFLVYGENAYQCAERIETLRENYPPEALACCLNLLGSHDKPRIASVLGGGPDESQLPEEERGRFRLDENSMGLAKGRFWLATLMQMTLPGVPSIYYGDEYALEGLSDPGNRRTLPTPDAVHDRDMLNMVRNTIMLRRALPFLIDGTLDAFAYNDDVLCATAGADRMARSQASSSITACPMRAPCGFPSRGFCPRSHLGQRPQARGRWLRGGASMATRIGGGVFQ